MNNISGLKKNIIQGFSERTENLLESKKTKRQKVTVDLPRELISKILGYFPLSSPNSISLLLVSKQWYGEILSCNLFRAIIHGKDSISNNGLWTTLNYKEIEIIKQFQIKNKKSVEDIILQQADMNEGVFKYLYNNLLSFLPLDDNINIEMENVLENSEKFSKLKFSNITWFKNEHNRKESLINNIKSFNEGDDNLVEDFDLVKRVCVNTIMNGMCFQEYIISSFAILKKTDKTNYTENLRKLKHDKFKNHALIYALINEKPFKNVNFQSLWQSNREILMVAINKKKSLDFQYADEKLKNDKELALLAVKNSGKMLKYVSNELKKDREIVFTAIKCYPSAHKFVDKTFKKDKDFALVLASVDPYALRHLDSKFKKDDEVVLKSLDLSAIALQYADKKYGKDRNIVLKAVGMCGSMLEFADEKIKKDREVVLKAVQQNGLSLFYADASLKNDKDIVLKAVQQNGRSLGYASNILKKDRDVVLTAIKQTSESIFDADVSLVRNKAFIDEAVKHNSKGAAVILNQHISLISSVPLTSFFNPNPRLNLKEK